MVNLIWLAHDKFLKLFFLQLQKNVQSNHVSVGIVFDFRMLEQYSAPAHRACEMVKFLAWETPDFSPHVV